MGGDLGIVAALYASGRMHALCSAKVALIRRFVIDAPLSNGEALGYVAAIGRVTRPALTAFDYAVTGFLGPAWKNPAWSVFVEETSFGEHISQDARRFLEIYEYAFVDPDRIGRLGPWSNRFLFVLVPGLFIFFATAAVWLFTHGLGRRLAAGETGASTQ